MRSKRRLPLPSTLEGTHLQLQFVAPCRAKSIHPAGTTLNLSVPTKTNSWVTKPEHYFRGKRQTQNAGRLTHHLLELVGPPRALARSGGGVGGIGGGRGGGGRDSIGIGGGRHGNHPPLPVDRRDARVVGAELLLLFHPVKTARCSSWQGSRAEGQRRRGSRNVSRGAETRKALRVGALRRTRGACWPRKGVAYAPYQKSSPEKRVGRVDAAGSVAIGSQTTRRGGVGEARPKRRSLTEKQPDGIPHEQFCQRQHVVTEGATIAWERSREERDRVPSAHAHRSVAWPWGRVTSTRAAQSRLKEQKTTKTAREADSDPDTLTLASETRGDKFSVASRGGTPTSARAACSWPEFEDNGGRGGASNRRL